jgi:hypothetical protein
MKIGQVAKLCKAERCILLVNEVRNKKTVQWIGTPSALYPFYGLPIMDEKTVFAVFDIDHKKKEMFTYKEYTADEFRINISETDETEQEVKPENVTIYWKNVPLLPVNTSKGMYFIDRTYTAPLMGAPDVLAIYERRHGDQIYFIIRMGLFVAGVVTPFAFVTDETVRQFANIAERMKYANDLKQAEKTVLIDRVTGEIMDGAADDA